MRLAGLDRRPQRRRRPEQVPLADELLERPRAHPRGQRRVVRRRRAAAGRLVRHVEQASHARHSLREAATRLGTMSLAEELQEETAEVLAQLIRFRRSTRRATSASARSGWPATSRTPGWSASCTAPSRSAQPGRAAAGGATARSWATSAMWTPCWPTKRTGPPTRGAPSVRDGLPLRPRGDRHEGPDGGGGGRGSPGWPAGRRALRRRAEAHQRRRRGDRRRRWARKWITEEHPELSAGRLPAQRGRRRGHALRRPAPVRRLRGREGHVPLRSARPAAAAHASVPGLAENALLKLAAGDRRAGRAPPRR